LEWLKVRVDPSAAAPADATDYGPLSWEREITTLPGP
jgi:hypothetical protein